MLSIEQIQKLDELITLMASTAPFSDQELQALWEKDKKRERAVVELILSEGVTFGEASGGHDFLNQSEENFKAYIKGINIDLVQQVAIVLHDFKLYLERGDAPAPYYPWRIAVILRKTKSLGKEKEFLNAWCSHFSRLSHAGARYRDLVMRADKIKIHRDLDT